MVARKRTQATARPDGAVAKSAVELPEVLAAIESLYIDRIKPVSRILRKRISERSPVSTTSGRYGQSEAHCEMNSEDLRALCSASGRIFIERDDAGDWAALLVGRPQTFIDVYGQVDAYGKELWDELTAHCRGDSGAVLRLPGGRYACAVALQALALPCLSGRCLGEIAHIVQIAISQRKILGYSSGGIVHYSHSQSMMKEECAKARCPCSGALDPTMVASWEVARGCLWQILHAAPSGELPLPNVKRLFRSKFHLDLSETAFGYSKVSEFLQDQRFQDLCGVELRGHGYVVVLKRPTGNVNVFNLQQGLYPPPWFHSAMVSMVPIYTSVPAMHTSVATHVVEVSRVTSAVTDVQPAEEEEVPRRVLLCEPLCLPEGDNNAVLSASTVPVSLVMTPATPGSPTPKWCLTPSTCLELSQDGYRSIVQNTFIQVKKPQPPQLPKSRSMPAGLSIGCCAEHQCTPLSHSGEAASETSDASGFGGESSPSPAPDAFNEDNDELNPLRVLLQSLPKVGGPEPAGAGTPMDGALVGTQSGHGALRPAGKKRTANRVNFCLDVENTPFEDHDDAAERVVDWCIDALEPQEPSYLALDALEPQVQTSVKELPNLMTPGTFCNQGFVISNGFLCVKKEPPIEFMKRENRRLKTWSA